jgi:hypothetical protein
MPKYMTEPWAPLSLYPSGAEKATPLGKNQRAGAHLGDTQDMDKEIVYLLQYSFSTYHIHDYFPNLTDRIHIIPLTIIFLRNTDPYVLSMPQINLMRTPLNSVLIKSITAFRVVNNSILLILGFWGY